MSRTFVTLLKNYIAFFLCLNNKARNKVVVGITKSKCQIIFLQIVKKILQVEAWSLRGLVHEGLGPNTIQDGGLLHVVLFCIFDLRYFSIFNHYLTVFLRLSTA